MNWPAETEAALGTLRLSRDITLHLLKAVLHQLLVSAR